jgi:hypothetical protein
MRTRPHVTSAGCRRQHTPVRHSSAVAQHRPPIALLYHHLCAVGDA